MKIVYAPKGLLVTKRRRILHGCQFLAGLNCTGIHRGWFRGRDEQVAG